MSDSHSDDPGSSPGWRTCLFHSTLIVIYFFIENPVGKKTNNDHLECKTLTIRTLIFISMPKIYVLLKFTHPKPFAKINIPLCTRVSFHSTVNMILHLPPLFLKIQDGEISQASKTKKTKKSRH